jgi:hypothetical protein
MTEVERLQKAILDLHGLKSTHVQSVPVHETLEGKAIWSGTVEVFQVQGHDRARFAYAWNYEDDSGKRHYVAVLGVPPVNSASDAVRAYIVSESQKKKSP